MSLMIFPMPLWIHLLRAPCLEKRVYRGLHEPPELYRRQGRRLSRLARLRGVVYTRRIRLLYAGSCRLSRRLSATGHTNKSRNTFISHELDNIY